MSSIEFRYTLHRVRSGRLDADLLAKALIVYHANTPQKEACSTKEFEYWCDRYNEQFEDELFIFALEENDEVVGFAECILFHEEEFIALDYMTISQHRMTIGLFFTFYEQIKYYFKSKNVHYDFVVAELLMTDTSDWTESSVFWHTMMALENFRIIDGKYVQLQLGAKKYETRSLGRLMISINSEVTSISRDTYLLIVETIFFKHYVRWYEPLMSDDEFSKYKKDAIEVFSEIKNCVANSERLSLSEVKKIPLPTGAIHGAYKANVRLIAYETISYLIIFAILFLARATVEMGARDVILLALVALFIRMALLSVFVKEGKDSLAAAMNALSLFLGKKYPITSKKTKNARISDKPVKSRK